MKVVYIRRILLSFLLLIFFNGQLFAIAPINNNQSNKHFIAGEHFKVLSQVPYNLSEVSNNHHNKVATATNHKPQVIIFFSYGCMGCRHINASINQWERSNKSKAVIYRYPVSFNKPWENLAKFYYVHQEFFPNDDSERIFTEIFSNGKRLWTEEEMVKFYEQLKIPKDLFLQKYHSFSVDRQVKKATEIANYYKIVATPNIVVNHNGTSYMVNFSMVPDPETLLQVVNYLIDNERKSI